MDYIKVSKAAKKWRAISLKSTVSLFVMILLISFSGITVFAQPLTENPSTSSEAEIDESTTEEYEDQISSLIEQNENNQKIIEENQSTIESYRSLYGTWTTVIFVLFTLFGIALPIALAIGLDKWNKRDVNKEIDKVKKQSEEQYQKLLYIQNALSFVGFEHYWEANECFKSLLKKYPNDPYVKIYSARSKFRELVDLLSTNSDEVIYQEQEIYDTINTFIDWYYETDGQLTSELMIGSIFGSSTVHEVSILIGYLGNCDQTNAKSDFIKICKKASKYILDTLNIKNEEELFDCDQTDVFIMNYKIINYYLCLAYHRNKSIALKKQILKTIRLYNADEFSRQDDNLKKCKEMFEELH